jgi:hypothetical protein
MWRLIDSPTLLIRKATAKDYLWLANLPTSVRNAYLQWGNSSTYIWTTGVHKKRRSVCC